MIPATKLAVLVLVCCLGAGGQTYQGRFAIALPDGRTLATCDNRSSSLESPDLDNCELVQGATLTHVIMALIHKPYPEPQDAPAKPRRDGWLCNTNRIGDPILETCKPNMVEALDVPGIEVADEWGNCTANAGMASRGKGYECFIPNHISCADKTRILEHDEQTPPKYWCRKVQP